MPGSLISITGVLGFVAMLFAGTRLIARRYSLHPEYSRKIAHIGSGLIAFCFPWIFHSAWAVVTTCAAGAIGIMVLRRSRRFGRGMTDVLGGVPRGVGGEYCLPLAAALLFVLSKGSALLYCIPLLILTLADTAAALVGSRYGHLFYGAAGRKKSVEGSLAFFVVAVPITLASLLLFTDIGPMECLLISLLVGSLTTVTEAIGSWGEDNVTVPLLAFITLKFSIDRNYVALGLTIGVALKLLVLVFLARHRKIVSRIL